MTQDNAQLEKRIRDLERKQTLINSLVHYFSDKIVFLKEVQLLGNKPKTFANPVFDSNIDDGAGGQPNMQTKYWYQIGKVVYVYFSLGSNATKVGTNTFFNFTLPPDLPPIDQTKLQAYEVYGFGYLLNTGQKGVTLKTNNSYTLIGVVTSDGSSIPNNTALSSSGFFFQYLTP